MSPQRNRRRPNEAGSGPEADLQEFAAQYRSCYRRLTLVAAAVTGDRQSAEDLVQEAATIALGKWDQFQPGTSFGAWLAEIVRRCALNHRRKCQSRRTYAADPSVLSDLARPAPGAADASPLAAATGQMRPDQSAFDDEVTRALAELGEEARACLLLRSIERLPYAEISQLLNIPEGTAMSHVHRSKAALRKRLSPDDSEPRNA